MFEIVSSVIFIGYLLVGSFLYLKQDSYLYHPTPNSECKYKSMQFENEGETLNVFVLHEGNTDAILYFGASSESMAESTDYIAAQFLHHTIYLLDYRGYGASTGHPSEDALYSDAVKLYDSIKDKHKRISIGGRSLGSALATYVAAHRDVYKLALITPFDSIINVAQGRYPIYPVKLLLDDHYKSIDNVPDIKAKTFIVYAENDISVPFKYTKHLIDAFDEEQLKVTMIEGKGHHDISDDDGYYKIMQDFIGKAQ